MLKLTKKKLHVDSVVAYFTDACSCACSSCTQCGSCSCPLPGTSSSIQQNNVGSIKEQVVGGNFTRSRDKG